MRSLRQRMLEDMQVRRLSPFTQRTYVETVARFARYFNRSPERLCVAVGTLAQRAAGQRLEAAPVVSVLPVGLLCRCRRGVSSNRRHSASFCSRARLARNP